MRRIFALCLDGKGPSQIAAILSADDILTPSTYEHGKTGKCGTAEALRNPTLWSEQSVAGILERREYLGHTVSGKFTKPSYKSRDIRPVPQDKQLVTENTHAAIIDEETFTLVQKVRENKRRPAKVGGIEMFSGLVYCADCGRVHHNLRAKSVTRNQESFVCSGYRAKVSICTAHYIRTVVLERIVLESIRRVSALAREQEDSFVKMVMEQNLASAQKELTARKKELEKSRRRITELDGLFKRLYEDHVAARLSEERYEKLSADYEAEQKALTERAAVLETELSEQSEKVLGVEKFLAVVRRYTDIQELTPTLLREFVDKIIVHEPDKSSGKRKQKIEIYYNFVGEVG